MSSAGSAPSPGWTTSRRCSTTPGASMSPQRRRLISGASGRLRRPGYGTGAPRWTPNDIAAFEAHRGVYWRNARLRARRPRAAGGPSRGRLALASYATKGLAWRPVGYGDAALPSVAAQAPIPRLLRLNPLPLRTPSAARSARSSSALGRDPRRVLPEPDRPHDLAVGDSRGVRLGLEGREEDEIADDDCGPEDPSRRHRSPTRLARWSLRRHEACRRIHRRRPFRPRSRASSSRSSQRSASTARGPCGRSARRPCPPRDTV